MFQQTKIKVFLLACINFIPLWVWELGFRVKNVTAAISTGKSIWNLKKDAEKNMCGHCRDVLWHHFCSRSGIKFNYHFVIKHLMSFWPLHTVSLHTHTPYMFAALYDTHLYPLNMHPEFRRASCKRDHIEAIWVSAVRMMWKFKGKV